MHKYTPEQKAFIADHVKGRTSNDLTYMFNDHFGLDLPVRKIQAFKKNNNLKCEISTTFTNGHTPFNKGTKGISSGGVQTQFKKGQRPSNYKPVGYERVDRDGYILVKVQDDGPWQKRWRHKHKVIWEKTNGPIPHGHAIIFSDANPQNIVLENLILVTKAQLVRMNQKRLISSNPEETKTGIIIADIYNKIGERKRKKQRNEKTL